MEVQGNAPAQTVGNFVREHGLACGGNWTAMFMSAIERGLPTVFESMEDRPYEFDELVDIIRENMEVS